MLIFILQSASAGFTPTFQATIPDVLPDEKDYTRALSLSRLAYDMESLVSPILAAALLGIMSFHWLFSGTAIGFACSALLVLSVTLPRTAAKVPGGGIRSEEHTSELQSLMRISYAVFCLKKKKQILSRESEQHL